MRHVSYFVSYLVIHYGYRFNIRACCLFQAEDGIRDLVRSRGLGDVYKRQVIFLLAMSMVQQVYIE